MSWMLIPLWGGAGDVTAQGDYEGDRKTDAAVFRPSNGTWFIRHSSTGATFSLVWGGLGDVAVPADYDGDGKSDLAVFRPSNGTWYIRNSGTGTSRVLNWGLQFDQPMTTAYRIMGAQQIGQTLTEE